MKKNFYVFVVLFLIGMLVACKDTPEETLEFTVTFVTGEGGTVVAAQEIENGGKVTKPADPTREGYVFGGSWMNGSFEWNFAVDIVTDDLTLTATWIEISSTPTEVKMVDETFSSSLTWMQTDADLQTFTVSIKEDLGASFQVIDGTIDVDTTNPQLHKVTFTPTVLPDGGYYDVKIQAGLEIVEVESLLFGGAGSETNPYVVTKVTDVLSILDDEVYSDKHFIQYNDILSTLTDQIEITNERKLSFSGVYDGQNYAISFIGNGGLFHEILEGGIVKNLVIDGTTNLFAAEVNLYPIGAVADINAGLIDNVSSRALLENARLQGELPVFTTVDTEDQTTGAGGIVGINELTGIISNVTVGGSGAVKAGRGIGGVAAYNYGLIEKALVTATLPAGNQANTARSSNTYSYGGGIAGFNFGTIQQSTVSGRVFAQSAYSETGNGNEGKNIAFGGIAGYNEGIITNSSFARNLTSKEFIDKTRAEELADSANNLGVASIHGDLYVGGIAGINAGEITSVYVGGALIGGRDFIGGIAGLTLDNSVIANSYVFAEVAIKDDAGVKITVAGDKTTLTTYDIAPDYDVNSVVFKRLLNSATDEIWVPGQLETPKLPTFTAEDLQKVGINFNESGVLLWQQGSVTSVNIVLDTVAIPHGSTLQLEYVIEPSNAPDIYTMWASSNSDIVEVIGEGLIKGVGAGTATITVTTRDGGFTDTIEVTVEDYTKVTEVIVTSPEITLPQPNNSDDRLNIDLNTIITFNVELLPLEAQYKNYTLSSSNSRAEVDGDQVTFVYGATGPGRVSITISFEDSSVQPLEYRFLTVEPVVIVDIPISEVSITSPEITLPEANNDLVRDEIEIGTIITINVAILPIDATNQNYSITTSNSRAEVTGNQVVFVYGATGPGSVSVYVTFDDTSIGDSGVFNFRFTTIEGAGEDVPITSVSITSPEITLPEANNAEIRQDIYIGSVVNIVVDILPLNATNKNYTVTVSNSRGTVNGNEVTFNELGLISILVIFEDINVGVGGEFNFRFTIVEEPADIPITSVSITSPEITLPEANNDLIRPEIEIGTVITIDVEILPVDATNQNYTITTSNSRAEAVGNQITFVYGATGPGSVSVYVTFEDTSIGDGGVFNFRFATIEAPVNIPISSVSITSPEITLPEANNSEIRPTIEIGTVITIDVEILPVDATNQNYTITTSNSRAEAVGNQVTFVYGLTGPGLISIYVTFEDTSIGDGGVFNFRFSTIEAPVNIPIDSVSITSPDITLPEANNAEVRQDISIGTVINLLIDILPIDASNPNYTITVSNSRGTVTGNQVSFNTLGLISIYVTFEDTSIGDNGVFNFRFTIV